MRLAYANRVWKDRIHMNLTNAEEGKEYIIRQIETDDEELDAFLQKECNIIQDPGFWFGEGGKGFTRLNVACPRSILEKSINELKNQILKRV